MGLFVGIVGAENPTVRANFRLVCYVFWHEQVFTPATELQFIINTRHSRALNDWIGNINSYSTLPNK